MTDRNSQTPPDSFDEALSEILTPAPPGKSRRMPETGRPPVAPLRYTVPPKKKNVVNLLVRLVAGVGAVLMLIWFALIVAGR